MGKKVKNIEPVAAWGVYWNNTLLALTFANLFDARKWIGVHRSVGFIGPKDATNVRKVYVVPNTPANRNRLGVKCG